MTRSTPNPANALYVFAPGALGLLAALSLAPAAIDRYDERAIATSAKPTVAIAMSAPGLVGPLTAAFGWLLVLDIPGVGERVEMAAALSVPLGLGMTLAAAATQTYIGRSVPTHIPGRVFALLGARKDGLAIAPLLGLGALVGAIGVRAAITLAPVLLLVLAYAVEWIASRWRAPRWGCGAAEPRGAPRGATEGRPCPAGAARNRRRPWLVETQQARGGSSKAR